MIVLMFNFLITLPFSEVFMRCWKGLIKVGAAGGISRLCIYKFVMMWWGPFNCMDGIRWRLKLLIINMCNFAHLKNIIKSMQQFAAIFSKKL